MFHFFFNRRRRFLCFAFWEKMKVDEDLNENAFGEKKEKKMQKKCFGILFTGGVSKFYLFNLKQKYLQ